MVCVDIWTWKELAISKSVLCKKEMKSIILNQWFCFKMLVWLWLHTTANVLTCLCCMHYLFDTMNKTVSLCHMRIKIKEALGNHMASCDTWPCFLQPNPTNHHWPKTDCTMEIKSVEHFKTKSLIWSFILMLLIYLLFWQLSWAKHILRRQVLVGSNLLLKVQRLKRKPHNLELW